MEDVWPRRKTVLWSSDEQVEPIEGRLGVHEVHEPSTSARSLFEPQRHRHTMPGGGNHEIRPRRSERTGFAAVQADQRSAEQKIWAAVQRIIHQLLRFVRPTEGVRQARQLPVVASLSTQQDPNFW